MLVYGIHCYRFLSDALFVATRPSVYTVHVGSFRRLAELTGWVLP